MRRKHSPAGASHKAGYSLSEMNKALIRAEKLRKEVEALSKATSHVKGKTLRRKSDKKTRNKSSKNRVLGKSDYSKYYGGYLPFKTSDRIK